MGILKVVGADMGKDPELGPVDLRPLNPPERSNGGAVGYLSWLYCVC